MEIADFINSTDPVRAIASHNQFCATTDESKKIFEAVPPSEDLKEFFNDIGVIGKTEYKAILKWRLQVRRVFLHLTMCQSKHCYTKFSSTFFFANNISINSSPDFFFARLLINYYF